MHRNKSNDRSGQMADISNSWLQSWFLSAPPTAWGHTDAQWVSWCKDICVPMLLLQATWLDPPCFPLTWTTMSVTGWEYISRRFYFACFLATYDTVGILGDCWRSASHSQRQVADWTDSRSCNVAPVHTWWCLSLQKVVEIACPPMDVSEWRQISISLPER